MTPQFHPITQRGYDLFEVRSALQKEIRRGNEKAAAYWAVELLPRYEAYLWKTLKTILNEDVGIANPTLFPIIQAIEAQYYQTKDTMVVVNAVLLMARSPKTRIACHLSIILEQGIAQGLPKLDVPDYALDCHTAKGRKLGRTLDNHFRHVGAKLENEVDVGDVYADDCYRLLKTEKKFSLKAGEKSKAGDDHPAGSLFNGEE